MQKKSRKRRILSAETYQILFAGTAIQCLKCNLVSHHPRDVSDRYCGNCKYFHHQQSFFEVATMPLPPERTTAEYRRMWTEKRIRIFERDGYRCQVCGKTAGDVYRNARDKWCIVRLQCAHRDRDWQNDDEENLFTLCEKDHLNYDRPSNVEKSHLTRATRKDQNRPFLVSADPPPM